METSEVYVTYELGSDSTATEAFVYPGCRQLPLRGEIRSWRVGHFELDGGDKLFGVRITYTQPSPEVCRAILQEFIELPLGARNVQVHIGALPSGLEAAFNAAV